MRGKWKYVLLVFALLILGAGGYGVYVFKFKEYDVADPELDEIVEDPYVVTLPDGTQLVRKTEEADRKSRARYGGVAHDNRFW